MIIQPSAVSIIQSSFEQIKPNAGRFTRVFYDRLFERDPSLKKLFIRDIREQRKKFFRMLGSIVKNLSNPDELEPKLQDLGSRHDYYSVKREDYRTFFEAFIYTLAAALGNDFDENTRHAWRDFCDYVGAHMCKEIRAEREEIMEQIRAQAEAATAVSAESSSEETVS